MAQSGRIFTKAKRITGPASRPGEESGPFEAIATAVLLQAVRDVRSTGQYRQDAANWLAGDGLVWLDRLVTGIDPDFFLAMLKDRFQAGRHIRDNHRRARGGPGDRDAMMFVRGRGVDNV
jgi:hypothetical protein